MEKDQIRKLILQNGISHTAELLGMSDKTVRKMFSDELPYLKEQFKKYNKLKNSIQLYENLNWEEIYEFYKTHSASVTAKEYHMKANTLLLLLDYYGYQIIERNKSDLTLLHNNNREKSVLEKYGVTNVSHLPEVKEKIVSSLDSRSDEEKEQARLKTKNTKKLRYGDENYYNLEKARRTNLERYGVTSFSKTELGRQMISDQAKKRRLKKWKEISPDIVTEEYKAYSTHQLAARYHMHTDSFFDYLDYYNIQRHTPEEDLNLMTETITRKCTEKYGSAPWVLGLESQKENGILHGGVSKPEKRLSNLLAKENIFIDDTEYKLENRWYDFKIGNTLIELNPSSTHNLTWSPYTDKINRDSNYHKEKSLLAEKYNFRCIHLWDWDDYSKVIFLVSDRNKIYARSCQIKHVTKQQEKEFLDKYHFQNYIKSSVAYGLYYNDELVSIMTFGNPRYNKNYEWELLRYCSSYNVVGGAEKLFKHFSSEYNPKSIISYCDKSKFSGNVYEKLGFTLKSTSSPRRHWYNLKSGQHITDNLLLQRGYDQLFGTNFGKEFTNEELMISSGFVEIYDCGQSTYIFEGA